MRANRAEPPRPTQRGPTINAKQPSILVVDDTVENLRLISRILAEQTYRIRVADNGQRALISARANPPDLILLDIMLPDIDGYEVCRRLKADAQTRDIPIIFISALSQILDKITAFDAGGVDYITKPFQKAEVLARVHTHLSLQKIHHQLQEQNEQLERQNQELDAFAHTVAHDLKNPLAILFGYANILAQEAADLTPEELVKIGQATKTMSHKAINIIEGLLLLASVRQEEVQLQPVDMGAIVGQARERIDQMIAEYQAEIILPASWPVALGYAPWIEEIWVNYLSNGLKYGGRPPHLELGADPQPAGAIRFWVQDNGDGIPPEAQATLFTEFTRLSEARVGSHGLGLSIVRRIAEKLGGEVGVVSPGAPGQGSRFYLTLPADASAV
ncbi:MAG: sensor histidine kinase, partial [Anaerolineales bacterium]